MSIKKTFKEPTLTEILKNELISSSNKAADSTPSTVGLAAGYLDELMEALFSGTKIISTVINRRSMTANVFGESNYIYYMLVPRATLP